MTILCRPVGRGNWTVVTITIDQPADLFRFRINQRLPLGDVVYRIVAIRP